MLSSPGVDGVETSEVDAGRAVKSSSIWLSGGDEVGGDDDSLLGVGTGGDGLGTQVDVATGSGFGAVPVRLAAADEGSGAVVRATGATRRCSHGATGRANFGAGMTGTAVGDGAEGGAAGGACAGGAGEPARH